jgi:hypothetical protein
MRQEHAVPSYRPYWIAWVVLLVLTLAMVFIGSRPVLVAGMLAKATIITLLYMHLCFEQKRLALTVLLGIFATTAVLVVLLVQDGRAM